MLDNNSLSVSVELDKLVKVDSAWGHVVMVGTYIDQVGGIQFAANSTSFTGYLLE